MSKKLIKDMFEDYEKMQILRRVAKKFPDSQLQGLIKYLDRKWDELILTKKLSKKKKAFVTKF